MGKSNGISIDQLETECLKAVNDYCETITQKTRNWLKSTAKETAENVKKYAKSAGFVTTKEHGSAYVRSWSVSEDLHDYIVHNKKEYRLAHLLEKGHAVKSWGQTRGQTRAFPHISKAEKDLEKYFEKFLKDLEGGK